MATYQLSKEDINTINSLSLVGGDVVKIEEDSYDPITLNSIKGTQQNPIIIEGLNATFTGELILDNWVSEGLGKYSITNGSFLDLKLLTIDGKTQPKGRFPKVNNFVTDAAFENKTITNNELKQTPNYKGAEIVVNKNSWIQDVGKITSHIGGTLSYEGTSYYPAKVGWSFFVQNHPSCLTEFGDWYFDNVSKKIVMYFGDKNPDDFTIKVASENNLITFNDCEHIVFKNIFAEYANQNCVYLNNSRNIYFKGCYFGYSAINGIEHSWNSDYTVFNNCIIEDTYDTAIKGNSVIGTRVIYCIIKRNFIHSGTGQNGDGKGSTIALGIDNWRNGNYTIEDNYIEDSGYNGIYYSGSDINVNRNKIVRSCVTKEDGGAIYSFGMNSTGIYTNRHVKENTIIDCVPLNRPNGWGKSEVYGIYLDRDNQNTFIENNTLVNCNIPFFLNFSINNTVKFNKIYNPTLEDKSIYQTGSIVEGNEFYLLDEYEPETPIDPDPIDPELPIENEVITLHFKSGVNYTINFRID